MAFFFFWMYIAAIFTIIPKEVIKEISKKKNNILGLYVRI